MKSERSSSEYALLEKWVQSGDYKLQIQMGVALRQIAGEQDRVLDLRDKIRRKFGTAGLHVAQITQAGITTQLLRKLVELHHDPSMVQKWLVHFLSQAEGLVIFVKQTNDPETVARTVIVRLESNPAHMVILFGSGYAKTTVLKIVRVIRDDQRGYATEGVDEGLQLIVFTFTPEMKARISSWTDMFVQP